MSCHHVYCGGDTCYYYSSGILVIIIPHRYFVVHKGISAVERDFPGITGWKPSSDEIYSHLSHELSRLYGCVTFCIGWFVWATRNIRDPRLLRAIAESFFFCYVIQSIVMFRSHYTDSGFKDDKIYSFFHWMFAFIFLVIGVIYGYFRYMKPFKTFELGEVDLRILPNYGFDPSIQKSLVKEIVSSGEELSNDVEIRIKNGVATKVYRPVNLVDFDIVLQAVKCYRQIYNCSVMPYKFEVPHSSDWPSNLHGFRLGRTLLYYIKSHDFFRNHLNEARELKLAGFTPDLSSFLDEWSVVRLGLIRYKEIYGNIRVPVVFVIPKSPEWPPLTWELKLGARFSAIRCAGRYIKDHPDRKKFLDDLGAEWSSYDRLEKPEWLTTEFPKIFRCLQCYQEKVSSCFCSEPSFVVPSEFPWPRDAWGLELGKIIEYFRKEIKFIHFHCPKVHRALANMKFSWSLKRINVVYQNYLDFCSCLELLAQMYPLDQGAMVPRRFRIPKNSSFPKSCWNIQVHKKFKDIVRFDAVTRIYYGSLNKMLSIPLSFEEDVFPIGRAVKSKKLRSDTKIKPISTVKQDHIGWNALDMEKNSIDADADADADDAGDADVVVADRDVVVDVDADDDIDAFNDIAANNGGASASEDKEKIIDHRSDKIQEMDDDNNDIESRWSISKMKKEKQLDHSSSSSRQSLTSSQNEENQESYVEKEFEDMEELHKQLLYNDEDRASEKAKMNDKMGASKEMQHGMFQSSNNDMNGMPSGGEEILDENQFHLQFAGADRIQPIKSELVRRARMRLLLNDFDEAEQQPEVKYIDGYEDDYDEYENEEDIADFGNEEEFFKNIENEINENEHENEHENRKKDEKEFEFEFEEEEQDGNDVGNENVNNDEMENESGLYLEDDDEFSMDLIGSERIEKKSEISVRECPNDWNLYEKFQETFSAVIEQQTSSILSSNSPTSYHAAFQQWLKNQTDTHGPYESVIRSIDMFNSLEDDDEVEDEDSANANANDNDNDNTAIGDGGRVKTTKGTTQLSQRKEPKKPKYSFLPKIITENYLDLDDYEEFIDDDEKVQYGRLMILKEAFDRSHPEFAPPDPIVTDSKTYSKSRVTQKISATTNFDMFNMFQRDSYCEIAARRQEMGLDDIYMGENDPEEDEVDKIIRDKEPWSVLRPFYEEKPFYCYSALNNKIKDEVIPNLSLVDVNQALTYRIPESGQQKLRDFGYRIVDFGRFTWEQVLLGFQYFFQNHGHLDIPLDYRLPWTFLESLDRMHKQKLLEQGHLTSESKYRPIFVKLREMELGQALESVRCGDIDGYEIPERRKALDALGMDWGDVDSKYLRFRFVPMYLGLIILQYQQQSTVLDSYWRVPDDGRWPQWMIGMPLGRWTAMARMQQKILRYEYPERWDLLRRFASFPWHLPPVDLPMYFWTPLSSLSVDDMQQFVDMDKNWRNWNESECKNNDSNILWKMKWDVLLEESPPSSQHPSETELLYQELFKDNEDGSVTPHIFENFSLERGKLPTRKGLRRRRKPFADLIVTPILGKVPGNFCIPKDVDVDVDVDVDSDVDVNAKRRSANKDKNQDLAMGNPGSVDNTLLISKDVKPGNPLKGKELVNPSREKINEESDNQAELEDQDSGSGSGLDLHAIENVINAKFVEEEEGAPATNQIEKYVPLDANIDDEGDESDFDEEDVPLDEM